VEAAATSPSRRETKAPPFPKGGTHTAPRSGYAGSYVAGRRRALVRPPPTQGTCALLVESPDGDEPHHYHEGCTVLIAATGIPRGAPGKGTCHAPGARNAPRPRPRRVVWLHTEGEAAAPRSHPIRVRGDDDESSIHDRRTLCRRCHEPSR